MSAGPRSPERPHVAADPETLGTFAAETIARRARAAVAARGRFHLVLAGGTTPEPTYRALADRHASDVPWDRVHVWYGDERCVPPTDPASNHLAAERALLSRVPMLPEHVHRIRGEDAAGAAADRYESELREVFGRATSPEFDVVLLGVGSDGHTASLFPRSPVLAERVRWVSPATAPVAPTRRVTLTLPAFAGAREVVFLVTGASKRSVLAEILADPLAASESYPAAAVAARRSVAWWTDAAASGILSA